MANKPIDSENKSKKKRTLAEKISVMQVAQAGGQIYVKAEQSDKYVKVDDPAWNWGVSDYQPVDSISTITANAANASISYPSLIQKLNWMERGKKLENINSYANKVLNSAKNIIDNNLDQNLTVDMSGIDSSTIGTTSFYNRLLQASNNDVTTVNTYLYDFKEAIKPIIREKLLTNVKELVAQSIQTRSSNLPNEETLYTNTAPTEQDLKSTVQELSDKIAFDYPNAPDKSLIEYSSNNITMLFLKDVTNGNAVTISYDLERTTLSEADNITEITSKIDDVEKKYTVVTMDELENKANEILEKVNALNAEALENTNKLVDSKLADEHMAITEETNTMISDAIESYNNDVETKVISKAETTTQTLFENLSKNFFENQVSAIAITMLEKVYPIGAIYISSSATNPKDIFGFGTWTQITDRFILAAGSKYANGQTGGAATVTLTKNEMPSHNHRVTDPGHKHWISGASYDDGNMSSSGTSNTQDYGLAADAGTYTADDIGKAYGRYDKPATTGITINSEGGGQPHNNMPPYIVKYVWERTA